MNGAGNRRKRGCKSEFERQCFGTAERIQAVVERGRKREFPRKNFRSCFRVSLEDPGKVKAKYGFRLEVDLVLLFAARAGEINGQKGNFCARLLLSELPSVDLKSEVGIPWDFFSFRLLPS